MKLSLCASLLATVAGAQTSADWRIDTIAGLGEDGFSGDGGAAIEASLSYPTGVAVDGAGNLYIADHRATPESARWTPRGRSPPSRDRHSALTSETAARQPRPS